MLLVFPSLPECALEGVVGMGSKGTDMTLCCAVPKAHVSGFGNMGSLGVRIDMNCGRANSLYQMFVGRLD